MDIGRMVASVSTFPLEARTCLAAIVEMNLKLAGARDPELLLKGVSHVALETMPAQYAGVGILDQDEQAISGSACSSGMGAAAIPVLRPGLLANMLVTHKALRLRDVTSESLGFDLLPEDFHLASVLSVLLSGSPRIQGFLLFANRLDAEEFSDQDERVAVALARQVTLAYERMEEQRSAGFRGVEASPSNWSSQSPSKKEQGMHSHALCLYVQCRLSPSRSSTLEEHVLECNSCKNRLSKGRTEACGNMARGPGVADARGQGLFLRSTNAACQ
jgi:hypothetical protein